MHLGNHPPFTVASPVPRTKRGGRCAPMLMVRRLVKSDLVFVSSFVSPLLVGLTFWCRWWSLCSDKCGLYRHGFSVDGLPGTNWKIKAKVGEKWHFEYVEVPDKGHQLTIRREYNDAIVTDTQVAFEELPPGLCAFIDVNIDGDQASIDFEMLPPK
eukprot:m.225727 g.225727  ORF g.225727 m.225727 type:complete len:156 (+) comp18785_c2_seq1:435-902(+)